MAARIRYRLRIYGKVQGVFFRKYAQMTAQSLSLGGFIQNEMDGSVYAEVEGSPEAVENFVKWAHRGSPAAQVERVEVEGPLNPLYEKTFSIR